MVLTNILLCFHDLGVMGWLRYGSYDTSDDDLQKRVIPCFIHAY